MNGLIQLNRNLIGQAQTLVSGLPWSTYARKCEPVFSSSIGQHLRHCIEHYEEFFAAHADARDIDYEARPRDAALEEDVVLAQTRLVAIEESFVFLPEKPSPIGIRDTGASVPAASSLDRELQYLISHTVHHFAIISVIAKHFGVSVPTEFGIAPSTLKHRATA